MILQHYFNQVNALAANPFRNIRQNAQMMQPPQPVQQQNQIGFIGRLLNHVIFQSFENIQK